MITFTFQLPDSQEGIIADLKILILEQARLGQQMSEIQTKLAAADSLLYDQAIYELQLAGQVTVLDSSGVQVPIAASSPIPVPDPKGEPEPEPLPLPVGLGT